MQLKSMLVTHNNFFHFTNISTHNVLNRIILNDYNLQVKNIR